MKGGEVERRGGWKSLSPKYNINSLNLSGKDRLGVGRKKKTLFEKINNYNAGHRENPLSLKIFVIELNYIQNNLDFDSFTIP